MKDCNQKHCPNKLPFNSFFVNCDPCRAREAIKKQKTRARRGENGCCLLCGAKLVDNKFKFCPRCLEKKRINARAYADQKEKTGGKTTSQISKKALWEKARELKRSSQERAAREGADHKIAIWHIYDKLIAGCCEITGLPFVFGSKSPGIWSPSLDRWDPQNPNYTEDNVKVVIWGFNQFKFRWATQDWLVLLERCLPAFNLLPQQAPIFHHPKTIELDACKWNNWYSQAKHRAKKEDAKFEFLLCDFEDAIKKGVCQITGLPFDFSGIQQPDFSELQNPLSGILHGMLYPEDSGFNDYGVPPNDEVTPLTPRRPTQKKVVYNPWVPSIHRRDSKNRDYSKENAQFVCWAYNVAKSDFEDEDFKILLEALGRKLGYIDGTYPQIQLPTTKLSIPKQEIISIIPKIKEPFMLEHLEREQALQQLIIPPELCEASDGNWLATLAEFEKTSMA